MMENKKRQLFSNIISDLDEKMVFLSGPRQVGKTTLAKQVLKEKSGVYYSWDNQKDRRIILEGSWPTSPSLIVLDEIHKYRRWK